MMQSESFDLGDIVEFVQDLVDGDEQTPAGSAPGAGPPQSGEEPIDDLMRQQQQRVPELGQVGPAPAAEGVGPAPAADAPTEQELAKLEEEKDKDAALLDELSSMRHNAAMAVIGNIR